MFDAIVIGVGGMGAATCHELACRGLRVLGLERFHLVHDRGSSHGESRIIRKAYFEHPNYVPLLHRAYDLWHELEQSTGRQLLLPTGLMLSGPPTGETICGAKLSAAQHELELQTFTATDARERFPEVDFPPDHTVAYEAGAGTLRVESCVQAHVDEAVRSGATLHDNEQVLEWSSDGNSVRVRTARETYVAQKLVITAGAWANECLNDIGLRLQVLRKFVGWFPVRTSNYSAASGMPTFLFETPAGDFYGFPSFDGKTIKIAEHSGGQLVTNPLDVDRTCHPSDLKNLQEFIKAYLPGAGTDLVKHSVCLYTMSADKHFVIDIHPQWKNVAFAAGFSGHGFKFTPVIGEALADLVERGQSTLPIQFLSLARADLNRCSNPTE